MEILFVFGINECLFCWHNVQNYKETFFYLAYSQMQFMEYIFVCVNKTCKRSHIKRRNHLQLRFSQRWFIMRANIPREFTFFFISDGHSKDVTFIMGFHAIHRVWKKRLGKSLSRIYSQCNRDTQGSKDYLLPSSSGGWYCSDKKEWQKLTFKSENLTNKT
jgi:hypothetical protein